MDGLCRAVGGRVDIRLQNRTYFLRPLTLGDLASAEFHLLAKHQNPVERAERALQNSALPPGVRQTILERAEDEIRYDRSHRVVRADDVLTWLLGAAGRTFVAFHLLEKRPGKPRFKDWDQARRWLATLTDAERRELSRRFEMVSGFDVLSRLEWPEHGPGVSGRYVPWKKLAKTLIEAYHFDAAQLSGLTLTQVRVLMTPLEELGGTRTLTGKAAQAFARGGWKEAKRWTRQPGGMTPARQAFRRMMAEKHGGKAS